VNAIDARTGVATASAPVNDPSTGQFLGTLTLALPAPSANPFFETLVQRAAREIQHRLLQTPDGGASSEAAGVKRLRSERPTFGWEALTKTERHLADLVAEGLTNKQVAARLFLSRHTVDSHLRSIFRKLDINSRVELTRVVMGQAA
jgi:DNA-binding CsgD family transcriptional regulator